MFNFFANLALCVYSGTWPNITNADLINRSIAYLKVVPIFGLFNNSTEAFYNTTTDLSLMPTPSLAIFIACILSTICCISVFFIIVKAVKKLFTCFLDF